MPGPLDGFRVLDLTTMVSGPVAAMMLADQGADVIKIEPPGGELMRRVGVENRGMTSSFLCCNRGKRSLAVDLKSAEGVAVVRKLAATADVLVQNYRPGAIDRMGLGEEAVRAVRPDIVFVSISGFGETGPYAHKRVYDPVIQALSGLADIQADRATGEPRMVRTIVPDKTTALAAAQAIVAALLARERTGEGQHVRLSMLDATIAYLWPEGMSALSWVGREADPARGQMGLDLVFRAKDGHITAGAVTDAEWAGMCRALRREDLLDDPALRDPGAALRQRRRPPRHNGRGDRQMAGGGDPRPPRRRAGSLRPRAHAPRIARRRAGRGERNPRDPRRPGAGPGAPAAPGGALRPHPRRGPRHGPLPRRG